ncbi:hypothetical protein PAXRUDRAFT_825628 [Paxillus rubicundulus Ve08.2h10]|uniref:Uncharacterized protein n=1 Tax=Paxillus rubicundulus Ve08.2h10 TaxID=930991 RepID=A0A0D0DG03_9AGAM|nr:hypothetical protein PAXRUDRAFT_825628 [Paxillus rubicundulus Ve08.2h10]
MTFNFEFISNGRPKRCPQTIISAALPVNYFPESQGANSSPLSPHVAYSSTSPPPNYAEPHFLYDCSSSSAHAFDTSVMDNLDNICHDWDLDHCSQSSATLLSRSVSPTLSTNQPLSDTSHAFSDFVSEDLLAPPTESQHCFIYPLHEPGARTAEHIQRLRARTAAILGSLPATVGKITDGFDSHVPQDNLGVYGDRHMLPVASSSKLRRVSGIANLRDTSRDSDRMAIHPASNSRTEISKVVQASLELDMLALSSRSVSPFSACSSVDTLVDLGHALPRSSGDLKMVREATVSSISIASKTAANSRLTFFPLPLLGLPMDTPKPVFQETRLARDSLIPRPQRDGRVQHELHQNDHGCGHAGEPLWSCAKIARSASKHAARRGHAPRESRVFRNLSLAALPLPL